MNFKPVLTNDGATILIHIPMEFKRRGGRKEIIMPEGCGGAVGTNGGVHEPLVLALARAHRWLGWIESGQVASITELAEKLGVDLSYVARILRLALLAPDIVEAILQGNEPSGLSLAKLTRQIPMLWDEQRQQFGFPTP